ncbi:hypothetical protein [Mesorhizobium sp. CN2-181]|uniref:hypothetical protein n=1 Tax=Mesorhizobium yinganensis TaxID=3157707 RepID=UPI0032B70320
MFFNGSANPAQLKALRHALEAYCERYAITKDEERNAAAEMVMAIFSRGVISHDEIMAGMETVRATRATVDHGKPQAAPF